MKLKFCSIASGSKGNCYFIQSENTNLLVDIGISLKDLKARLDLIGVAPDDIDAVIVSHEHADHIKGVSAFSRRFNARIFINYPTLKSAQKTHNLTNIHEFDSAEKFSINDLEVTPFSVSHDAADPVGFSITANGKKIGIATDLGIATNLVKTSLRDCDALIIESNHDLGLLMSGPYPWFLKQRVRSRQGHLSNEDALELINEIICEKTRHVIFAHLSEINNNEAIVCSNVIDHYKKVRQNDVSFTISNQYRPVAVCEV